MMPKTFAFSAAGLARLCLLIALALAALGHGHGPAALAAPERTGEPYHPVISEFRARGPAGASDEFVEIFNPSGDPFDLSNWSLQKSSSCGFTVAVMLTLPAVTLPPGGYLLLTNAGGYAGAVPGDLPYPGSQSLAEDEGLALVNDGGVIMDQVGMCPAIVGSPTPVPSGQAFFEGGPLAAFPNTNLDQSYARTAPCNDQNDNSLDFFLTSAGSPQNASASPSVCANGATATPTASPTGVPARRVLINEVAWAGTAASGDDEWIELYNPGAEAIDLTGWVLSANDGSPTIPLSGSIPAGGFFLIERGDDNTVWGVPANLFFSTALSNSGETLRLYAPGNQIVDTANSDGGSWPAGSASPNYGSMERTGVVADATGNWITHIGLQSNGLDANGYPLRGSAGIANWAVSVTATPTATRTPTRTPSPTRTPTLMRGWVVINEFVPRAGTDWNGDGLVDVDDEYVELLNVGTAEVNLKGWRLDDDSRSGSPAYALPDATLQPGQHVVYYGAQTGILLGDNGDTVLLLRPGGLTADIFNYTVTRYADEVWCRQPEGQGVWVRGCDPSPGWGGQESRPITPAPTAGPDETLTPSATAAADGPPLSSIPPECLQPDLLPAPIREVLCGERPPSEKEMRRGLWLPSPSKWPTWME